MKIFFSALALVCVALAPEAWGIVPQFRAAVAWVGANAPVWIFGMVVLAIILDFLVKNWRSGK